MNKFKAVGAALIAEIKMNGCNYRFEAGTTVEAGNPDKLQGTADIICLKGAAIEVVAPLGTCTTKIAGQSGLGPVYYENNTTASPKDVVINPQITNITYSHSGFGCGSKENETGGSYTGNVTVKGENSSLTQTNTWVE
jgi:hypothetical protein